jgi:hypothetical protein
VANSVQLTDRAACAALATLFIVLWLLYGVPLTNLNFDPSFYYAHLASPLIDGDLDFANDGLPSGLIGRTPTGLTGSPWSAGPALLWAPFFVLAHSLTLAAQQFGFSLAADGRSTLYLTLVTLGSAFWGFVGILCCYALARWFASPAPALVAAAAGMLTTPLFQYMFRTALYAHSTTVALVSALVLVWWSVVAGEAHRWRWFLLGLLIGLAATQRWQNALFALLVPAALLPTLRQFPAATLQVAALSALGALIGFAPQMAVWWRLYGQPLAFPQGEGFLRWTEPVLAPLLFGSNRGLFVWQPSALFATVAMAFLFAKRVNAASGLLVVVALETYLNSIVIDWWGGGGFGPRRFDWLSPLIALGIALAAQRWWGKTLGRAIILLALTGLALHQVALAQTHYYRVMPSGAAFPIAAYDAGEPLPGLVPVVLQQAAVRPAWFVEVRPTLWSSAIPFVHALPALVGDADVQHYGVLFAGFLAPLLTLPLAYVAAEWVRSNSVPTHIVRGMCAVVVILSLAVSVVLLTI